MFVYYGQRQNHDNATAAAARITFVIEADRKMRFKFPLSHVMSAASARRVNNILLIFVDIIQLLSAASRSATRLTTPPPAYQFVSRINRNLFFNEIFESAKIVLGV